MTADPRVALAIQLFQDAYQMHMQGELEVAMDLYKKSISIHPTAEAYTFLGWTYRFMGKLDDAIRECKHAIEIDPTFGNPYNDIGAYLIEKGQIVDAIAWLEMATKCSRYDSYHYPWYNLGRAYMQMEMYIRARDCLQQALDIEPDYQMASQALQKVKRLIQ